MAILWGIDLGGTKVEGVVLDSTRMEQPLCRLRLSTGAERGYDQILCRIAEVSHALARDSGLPLPKRLGMGTPGTLDPTTRLLKNSNTQCLNGRPLVDDLKERHGLEMVVANDANCFALAEATLGVARDYPTVFGVILGTGVGGGIVVNRHVLEGCHGIAGEWGQNVLEPGGPVSNYGTRGTVEAILAGPALERFYAERSGTSRKLAEIAQRDEAGGDSVASETMTRLTDKLAEALAFVINVLDPHAIVLGGGVGNCARLYTPELHEKILRHLFNPECHTAILRPQLGDSAGVFGAAMLVQDIEA